MTHPRISVCVPVYNGARYIEACLASIAAQTLTDFEVLIVDDCSSDDGMVIARRWAAADQRFHVHVNPKNLGLVGNWNRCIDLSRGKWIKYLFQDDLMEPECLAELLAVAETSEGFVACSRKLIFEGEHEAALLQVYADHRAMLQRVFGSGSRLSADEYSDVRLTEEGWNIIGEPSVTMIDRTLFERFGSFDPMLVQFCDSEMWNRLGTNVGIVYLGKELVSFRVHRGSVSEANRGREFRAKTLDQIIELKRLYCGPQYVRFRQYARQAGAPAGVAAIGQALRQRCVRNGATRGAGTPAEPVAETGDAPCHGAVARLRRIPSCLPGISCEALARPGEVSA